MANLHHADSFRDLVVYQKARELQREVHRLSMTFPNDEKFALTDQIRRSSRSIGANIAEVWAKRRYQKHFVSKLTDADGEQMETQHWIETALDCNYWPKDIAVSLTKRCEEIGRMLSSMMEKADLFCGEPERTFRESPPEYLVSNDSFTDD